jgi:putative transposase
MRFPLVLDLAERIPVAVTCRALGFSKQAFYAWKKQPVSQREWADAHLINARSISTTMTRHSGTGSSPMSSPLAVSRLENRVARLCSQQRIWSVFAKKRGLSRKAGPPVHDDLVNRLFTADRPDRLWLTEITEHPTAEGKLYLCAIKDACSGRISATPWTAG